mgnify:CR=1 FL=1
MKRWKTASNASGRSLARCWLKAEADDEPACRPKKSSSSNPGAGRAAGNQEGDEPVGPHFSGTGEILPGLAVYWEMLDTTWLTASAKSSFDVFM